MNNIPISKLTDTYGRVRQHKYIGEIIQKYSTNPRTIDSVAYKGLHYTNKINIADIGCGYGRCINNLTNIITQGSRYIGIDPLARNELQFIKSTQKANFIGEYVCGYANDIDKFNDKSFDLILCNYSLYFFIDDLPSIINKLSSNGIFITITHSLNSHCELLEDIKSILNVNHIPTWTELGSEQILKNFNAQNGSEILKQYFNDIEKINYKNNLVFYEKDVEILFDLLNFMKKTLIHNNNFSKFIKTKHFDDILRNKIYNKIKNNGRYSLNKDDVIFRCRNPKTDNHYEK